MAAPTLDNQTTAAFHGAGPTTFTLATSQNNVVICVASYSENGTNPTGQITSITGGSLTFVSRKVAATLTGGVLELWWALAPTALGSTVFTVNYSASSDGVVLNAFGVAGCATPSSPWDANGSLPAAQASATTFTPGTTISTTSANDFLLYFVGGNANFAASIVEPSGFTSINRVAGGFFDFADLVTCYQGVSAPQSSQAFTWGSAISGQDTAYGIFDALAGPSGAPPTLDGHAHGTHSGGGDLTLTLTTTGSNDVIIVQVYNELNAGAAAVSSVVAASGVTAFTKRARSNGSTNGSLEVWWGVAAAALSGVVITVHFAATYDDASAVAFGVNGCKTPASPWDSNVGLPGKGSWTANGSTPQITGVNTSQSNDFLIAPIGAVSGTNFGNPPSGWTWIDGAPNGGGIFVSNLDANCLLVSAKQSSLTVTGPQSLSNGGAVSVGGEMMVDALTGDVTATPSKGFFHNGFTALPSPALAAALLGIGAVRRNKVITRRALLGRG